MNMTDKALVIVTPMRDEARQIAATIAKLPELVRPREN
jgi:hypothetical protein